MKVLYRLSAPGNSVHVDDEHMDMPFLIAPNVPHPFLTLGHYFHVLKSFIFSRRQKIERLISTKSARGLTFDKLEVMEIISEKHGAFYHVSKISFNNGSTSCSLGINTAIGIEQGELLANEYKLMSTLNKNFASDHLPQVHIFEQINFPQGHGSEFFTFVLTDWLDGFYEWHIAPAKGGKNQEIIIWDSMEGHRVAEEKVSAEIFRQIARILTLYYNPHTFDQVLSWHNAAGDFVVKDSGPNTEVKLTTVRKYGPLLNYPRDNSFNPGIPLVYFFMDLMLRIRLDRLEGTGQPVWADKTFLYYAFRGFLEGFKTITGQGKYLGIKPDELLQLLKSFSVPELRNLMSPLISLHEDQSDLGLIKKHLNTHVKELKDVIGSGGL